MTEIQAQSWRHGVRYSLVKIVPALTRKYNALWRVTNAELLPLIYLR